MNERQKEYRTQIRFPADVWDKMKNLAQEHDRSLNGEVIRALRQYIQKEEGHKDACLPEDQA